MTGSGNLRDHTSWIAEGGQSTMAPWSFPRSVATTFGVSPERDALALVELGQFLHGAVEIDRLVVAGLPQQGHDPLRLAERVGADDMGALGEQRDGIEELTHLARRVRHPEDRQAEGRLGDEDIAGHHLEGQAGRVVGALVIARDHHPHALRLDGDLGRAEDMAGRRETHRHVADADVLAEHRLLARLAEILAVAHGHDPQGLARGQHLAVAGTGHGRHGRG